MQNIIIEILSAIAALSSFIHGLIHFISKFNKDKHKAKKISKLNKKVEN